MFHIPTFQELLLLAGIFILLNMAGLWPMVQRVCMRWVREWIGLRPAVAAPPPPQPSRADVELCYRLLGLSPSASWAEIQTAYRRKAKVHHPDHGGDEDAMRALNEAYQTLKRIKRA